MKQWEIDFDRVRGYLEAAIQFDSHLQLTIEELRKLIGDGKMQLWAADTSAIVTEIIDYGNGRQRVLHFALAGGNSPELEEMVPVVLGWGQHQGCTRATFLGRRGWERSFLKKDWTFTKVYGERSI